MPSGFAGTRGKLLNHLSASLREMIQELEVERGVILGTLCLGEQISPQQN